MEARVAQAKAYMFRRGSPGFADEASSGVVVASAAPAGAMVVVAWFLTSARR